MTAATFLLSCLFGLLVIRGLVYVAQSFVQPTRERRHEMVISSLRDQYRRDGHQNPSQAASDHILTLSDVERFRRWCCDEYGKTGESLDELKSRYWKTNAKGIQEIAEVTRSKPDALQFTKILKGTIFAESEDEVFVYGLAAERWKEEKAAWDAELDAMLKKPVERDEILDSVMDGAWAARGRL